MKIFGAAVPTSLAASFISGIRVSREERAVTTNAETPERAYERARARPMPFEAPVMKMFLPDTGELGFGRTKG